jgi:chromosome segregation ATPase
MDFSVVDGTLIQQALASAGPTRRDRVFAVAELWHRHTGSLPSTKEARDVVGKGSYGDVQRDLKDFASIIASKSERTAAIPGLPRDLELQMGEVLAGLWQTTYEKAQGEFAADRQALEAHLASITAKLDHAEQERRDAIDDRTIALTRWAELEQQLSAANASVATEQRKVSEQQTTIQQLQAHIGEMEAEKLRVKAAHELELRALQGTLKERDNRLLDLQNAAATIKAGYENQLAAAHTLEHEHRIRADRAEQGRQALQEKLEGTVSDLASHRERVRTLESDLETTKAKAHDEWESAQGQWQQLEYALEELKEAKASKATTEARLAENKERLAAQEQQLKNQQKLIDALQRSTK